MIIAVTLMRATIICVATTKLLSFDAMLFEDFSIYNYEGDQVESLFLYLSSLLLTNCKYFSHLFACSPAEGIRHLTPDVPF